MRVVDERAVGQHKMADFVGWPRGAIMLTSGI
jgi:hypothetical protein